MPFGDANVGGPRRRAADADERDLLDPPAAGRARLEAHPLHLRLDVGLGERVAARRRAAALEEVGREEPDVGAEAVGRDRRGGFLLRGRDGVLGRCHERGHREKTGEENP